MFTFWIAITFILALGWITIKTLRSRMICWGSTVDERRMPLPHFIMERKMLLNIKKLAKSRSQNDIYRWLPAILTWFGLLAIAFANGALREIGMKKLMRIALLWIGLMPTVLYLIENDEWKTNFIQFSTKAKSE